MKTLEQITKKHDIIKNAVISCANNYQIATSDVERRRDETTMKAFVQDHVKSEQLKEGYYQLFNSMIGREYK